MSTCPVLHDKHAVAWIHTLFGDCVYDWQECFSLLLGYLSIACWLNAQLPQVVKNYRLGEAHSLSFSFLTVWLLGDVANLIGCLRTGQLPFQTYLSIYFITIDTILCGQWLYYVQYPRWRHSNDKQDNEETQPLLASSSQRSTALCMIGLWAWHGSATLSLTTTPTLATAAVAADSSIWIGRIFAWLCTCLYLSSRVPQIIQNYQRHSVEGLAMALFFFAAMGNLTYTLSILTNPHATRTTLLEAIPYLLGSAGTLMFDGIIFTQYLLFSIRPNPPEKTLSPPYTR